MIFLEIALALLVLAVGPAWGQQPNLPAASMVIDGQDGPPWPIPFSWRHGLAATVSLGGQPFAPFLTAIAPQVSPGYLAIPGSLLDLDAQVTSVFLDGLSNPGTFNLDANGIWSLTLLLPPSMQPGDTLGTQTLLADATSPSGLRFTAATQISVVPGPTILNLTLADNSFLPIILPAGMVFPFYDTNYTTMFVNSNGSITFVNGDTDFTPTPTDMLSGFPKIAGYWADLDPQSGGSITVTIDTYPAPRIRVDFVAVPDRPNLAGVVFGFPHTFSMEIDAVPGGIGDLRLIYTAYTFMSVLPVICGISPGFGLDGSPQKDLSQIFFAGGQLGGIQESFYEWFGTTSMPGYTASTSNLFDLTLLTLTFTGVGIGTTTPQYYLH